MFHTGFSTGGERTFFKEVIEQPVCTAQLPRGGLGGMPPRRFFENWLPEVDSGGF